MKKRSIKASVLKFFLLLLASILCIISIYICYVIFSYDRIEDNQQITPKSNARQDKLKIGESYTALIQNLGFGAYTQDFTFFMDGGTQSWAKDADSVIDCINAAADKVEEYDADFILFQEVDFDSTRSYHIDQRAILESRFSIYSSSFAVNYHSAFLFYPLTQPHGSSNSGILTFSKFDIDSSVRRSLPISEDFGKFLDLDRCYSVSRVPAENGKDLVIYNVHMSAYGGSDEIRAAQMNMLFSDMKSEYDKGNYCLCGGDFNHDFTGDSTQKLNGGESVDFGWAHPFPHEMMPDGISRCTNYSSNSLVPTCRNCDVAYKPGNFTIIVDGFLISDNLEMIRVENLHTGFTYSDHNPVILEFALN